MAGALRSYNPPVEPAGSSAEGRGKSVRWDPEPGTALYVHLPFCAAKCPYCDFFSVPAEGQDLSGTIDAILAEAQARAPQRPRTVYLGGGTPSLFPERQLARLLDGLDAATDFRSSAIEVTAECNPESLDEDKARCLLDLGATRLSIGFQSLRPELLALFGRVHDVDDSFRAFEAARRAGSRNVNIDLIYAAPGQDLAGWLEDLSRVIALGPEHVSAYNLTFEEGTLFRRWLEQGRLQRQPEDSELEFFLGTRARLTEAGYAPYEISNFCLSDQLCAHNVNYWHNGAYVGLGPSAVSRVGPRRAGNVRSISEYLRRIRRARSAEDWSEEPGARVRLGETWWLGLRLREGLSPAEARERAEGRAWREGDLGEAIAERLAGEGLLERSGGRYRLTERGLPLADAVAREFLELPAEAPLDGSSGTR
jgi:oxygen-independent coproporphyrinogen-3 oxidase